MEGFGKKTVNRVKVWVVFEEGTLSSYPSVLGLLDAFFNLTSQATGFLISTTWMTPSPSISEIFKVRSFLFFC